MGGNIALAATMVGGFITSDTHWHAADSPFIAASSVVVDGGAALTIDPGVEVRFAPTTGLVVVDGTLFARGSSASGITFTADQPGDSNRWNGIRFGDKTVDAKFDDSGNYMSGSIIEYATVEGIAEHINGAVRVETSSPFIHASDIRDNYSIGIVALDVDSLRIVGNVIRNNDSKADPADARPGGGIDVSDSRGVQIANNEIVANSFNLFGGLRLHFTSDSIITGNVIERNFGRDEGAGFVITHGSNIVVSGNHIADNKGWEFRASAAEIFGGTNIALTNNTISGNDTVAGLAIERATGVTLTGDDIIDNHRDGIRFEGDVANAVLSSDATNPTRIFGNGAFEVYNN